MQDHKTILVIAAHPDDEVLGVGGTIARLTEEGNIVYCFILSEGITSRCNQADNNQAEQARKAVKQLKAQAEQATKILGIREVFLWDFPDNRFDTVPLLTIVKAIEEVKKEVEPDIVYTHHHGDLNIDHQITFRAVLTACRPVRNEIVKGIYSFEIPSSTEWNAPQAQTYFMPNVFVDISTTLDKKIEALKAYHGEIRECPHPRSPEVLRAIALRWGSVVGYPAAEAFELIRAVK